MCNNYAWIQDSIVDTSPDWLLCPTVHGKQLVRYQKQFKPYFTYGAGKAHKSNKCLLMISCQHNANLLAVTPIHFLHQLLCKGKRVILEIPTTCPFNERLYVHVNFLLSGYPFIYMPHTPFKQYLFSNHRILVDFGVNLCMLIHWSFMSEVKPCARF